MEPNNLLIQPRIPRVVMAQDLLVSRDAFDRHFLIADIVDFTEISQKKQPKAVKKYMKLYRHRKKEINNPEEFAEREKQEWQMRRAPDRMRRDYYLAALCKNDPALTHRLLYTANWDETEFQTNLLIVSNPKVSSSYGDIHLTDRHAIRYDYLLPQSLRANLLVLPETILSGFIHPVRRKMVHGLANTMYPGNHDDLHCITYLAEYYFRAGTAALFKRMPKEFRKAIAKYAVDCLSIVDDPKSFKTSADKTEQKAFWHGAFVYVSQYLFDFKDPLLRPFITKMKEQRSNLSDDYPIKLRDWIWAQLPTDRPEIIHNTTFQNHVLEMLQENIECYKKVEGPMARVSAFLPCRQPNGTTLFLPPPATRRASSSPLTASPRMP